MAAIPSSNVMPLAVNGLSECYPGSDMTGEEWEFARAMESYQRQRNRRYPSWSEVLHVLTALGYQKLVLPCESSNANQELSP